MMKVIKSCLLKFYTWIMWRQFLSGMKSVLGHKTVASSLDEMKAIEIKIRFENELRENEKITWENSNKTDRVLFARYVTLKHFNEIGELLAFFRNVDRKKILEVN